MNWIYYKKYLNCLFFCLLANFAQAQKQSAPIEFIKNEGQWDYPFLYKAILSSGDIFIEKNKITYFLADAKNSEILEKAHHGEVKGNQLLDYHVYKMNFIGSNQNVTIKESKIQSHYYNYFLGNDPKMWKSNIKPAHNVDYTNLYQGINLHLYSQNNTLKYDLIVAPNADITQVKFEYEGVDQIKIKNNCLEIKTSIGTNREMAPEAFQLINGERIKVDCNYTLKGNIVGFELGSNYNKNVELLIDPVVIFCTFTGSSADNWGYTATYDSLGNFYSGGIVGSSNGVITPNSYPTTTGAVQVSYGGGGTGGMGTSTTGYQYRYDGCISKFNPTGTALLYSTYFGGSDNDQPQSLIVDYNGNLVIAGRTYSNNLPTSTNAYDATANGNGDLFVTKFNWSGTALIGSTYLGGSADDAVNISAAEDTLKELKHNYSDDARSEVIIDSNNNVYVAASSKSINFPVVNANQSSNGGLQDGVVIKLNNNLSNLLWSTYIGGSGNDAAYVLSLDKKNNNILYVAGGTMSTNFTTTAGTIKTTYGGNIDGWLQRYNANTGALVASTFIGTAAYDQVYGVQTDDSNNVYIIGQSQGPYPIVGTVYNNANSSQFVTKINSSLTTKLLSTVFGKGSVASTDIAPNAFLVDRCNNIYISGWGGPIIAANPGSTNGLPVTPNAQKSNTDGNDFYFIVFSPNLSGLQYASFFGQQGGQGEHVDGGTSRFDPQGVIYQAICARCSDAGTDPMIVFPTTSGVWSPLNASDNCNLAAVKIDFQLLGAQAQAAASPFASGCAPLVVNFSNTSTNATTYLWNFGDGSATTTATAPTHNYTTAGTYTAYLVATNPNITGSCTGSTDTAFLIIKVKSDSVNNNFTIAKVDSCNPYSISVNNLSTKFPNPFNANTTFTWSWGDGNTSTGQNPSNHIYTSTGIYTVTLTITDTAVCNTPLTSTKVVNFTNNVISASFTIPDSVCPPYNHNFAPTTVGATVYNWKFGDGGTSTLPTPSHTYSVPGTYTISLIIGNPNSCNKLDSFKKVLHVRPTITNSFIAAKLDTCPPYKVSIANNSTINTTYPNASSWTTFTWNWGDGQSNTGQTPPVHIYGSAGTYTITLTLKDSTACNSPQTTSQVVTFADNTIRTSFVLPDTACVPYTHVFNNQTFNPNTYAWNFGSVGATSTSSLPTYTFANVGTYSVSLLVQNPFTCNLFDTESHVITIMPSPVADFYYLPNPPLPNKPVSFNNTSTGATRYLWDFGDGTGSTLENPTHLYNKSATLNVCLTAYSQFNCPNTTCRPIKPEVVNIIDVPTGFSPNGDGQNDFIQPRGYGVNEYDFRIFNRWGQMVFQSSKLGEKWDGKFKGVLQEADAFAYILQVTFTDNSTTTKKGSITLIR